LLYYFRIISCGDTNLYFSNENTPFFLKIIWLLTFKKNLMYLNSIKILMSCFYVQKMYILRIINLKNGLQMYLKIPKIWILLYSWFINFTIIKIGWSRFKIYPVWDIRGRIRCTMDTLYIKIKYNTYNITLIIYNIQFCIVYDLGVLMLSYLYLYVLYNNIIIYIICGYCYYIVVHIIIYFYDPIHCACVYIPI